MGISTQRRNRKVKQHEKQEKVVQSYSELTVDELREIARQKEIKGYYDMKKAELVKAIEG